MYSVIKGFSYGFSISFMGSLPPGVLNLTAVGFGASGNLSRALLFVLGVTLVEVAYLRITLAVMGNWLAHPSAMLICRIVTVVFLSLLAIATLRQKSSKSVVTAQPAATAQPFLLGILMAAMNPLQLVFWAGWASILMATNVLERSGWWYSMFSLGAGIGTFAALAAFLFAGHRLAGFLNAHQRKVRTTTGLVFATLAIYQLKMLLL